MDYEIEAMIVIQQEEKDRSDYEAAIAEYLDYEENI